MYTTDRGCACWLQALYSGNLGDENEQELRMLCSEVSSALALGSARIKVSHWRHLGYQCMHSFPGTI